MKRELLIAGGAIAIVAAIAAAGVGRGMTAKKKFKAPHVAVAQWDYKDAPNIHPIAHADGPLALPSKTIEAKNWIGTTAAGTTIRLVGLSKGNTLNKDHRWNPDGGFLNDPIYGDVENQEDQPATKDGPVRELDFEITGKYDPETSCLVYVGDGVQKGLTWEEKQFHGWDDGGLEPSRGKPVLHKSRVYVDSPGADTFIFGLAEGPWSLLNTVKNTLSKTPKNDDVIAKGPWGEARLVDRQMGAIYKGQPMELSKSPWGYGQLMVRIIKSEPVTDDVRLRAFDKSGTEIFSSWRLGSGMFSTPDSSNIDHWEVESRPYSFVKFTNVSFDPDPKVWSGIVWGPDVPSAEIKLGAVKVDIKGIQHLGPWAVSDDQYGPFRLYSPEGKLWKDGPGRLQATTGRYEYLPNGRKGKELPAPWFVFLNIAQTGNDDKAAVRMEIYGSDVTEPGKGLHKEWNKAWVDWNQYGEMTPYDQARLPSFVPSPEAKAMQIKIDAASGPFVKIAEIKPDLSEVKPTLYRDYTFATGSKPHARYIDKSGKNRVDDLGKLDLANKQFRTVAVLKSGERRHLKVTSYEAYTPGALVPSYDFFLNKDLANEPRNGIALQDVDHFEIEARPIQTSYFAFKIPKES